MSFLRRLLALRATQQRQPRERVQSGARACEWAQERRRGEETSVPAPVSALVHSRVVHNVSMLTLLRAFAQR